MEVKVDPLMSPHHLSGDTRGQAAALQATQVTEDSVGRLIRLIRPQALEQAEGVAGDFGAQVAQLTLQQAAVA